MSIEGKWVWAVVSASLLALTAACGGSSNAGNGGQSGTTDGGSSGVAAAKAFADEHFANPTSVGITEKLSKTPPTDKLIVGMGSPSKVTTEIVETGWKPAAEALGWKATSIAVGTEPEAIQKAFESALSLSPKPDAIIVTGYPRVTYEAQLKKAAAAGIPVFSQSTTDKPGDGLVAVTNGSPAARASAKMIGAHIVAESEGDAHVAFATVSAAPILAEIKAGLQDAFDEWCPKCTIDTVDAAYADIGSKLPGQLVSTIQRNPKINYIFTGIGDFAVGVAPALKAAGLADKVKIVGGTASAENLTALKAKEADAFYGFPAASIGYLTMDGIARHFVGDDPSIDTAAPFPTQIITPDNVANIEVTGDNYYIGTSDFADQWKTLWGVK